MSAHLVNCIVENLPAGEYHSHDATSATAICTLDRTTPLHTKLRLETPMDSKAMDLGTALHAAILEPDTQGVYAIAPPCDKRTTVGKETWRVFMEQNPGAVILDTDQGEDLMGMIASIRKDWRITMALKTCIIREVSLFGSVAGLPARARADAWDGSGMMLDLKTTRDLASPTSFERTIDQFGYGVRAAWYREVLRSVKPEVRRFSYLFAVVESKPPYATGVFRMSDAVMDAYQPRVEHLQRLWRQCVEKNEYPGWDQESIVDIGLPAWAMKKLENSALQEKF